MINLTTIKYACIAAALALYGWLAYDYGSTKVQEDWNESIAKLNVSTAEAIIAINKDNAKLSDELASKKALSEFVREVVRVETVEVENEVIKYVTKYRDSDCSAIDDDWVRIYNQSVERTKTIASKAE